MTEKEEKTTLERAELAVQTPIPERRRRRFWLLWWIWAVFGAAVSFRGTLSGSWIAIAAILTAPFWVMFILWPFFALRDRLRAKRLWAAEVLVLLAPETRGSDEEKTALPVVIGRDGGVLVPLEAWECAFPTIRPEMIPGGGRERRHLCGRESSGPAGGGSSRFRALVGGEKDAGRRIRVRP